MPRNSSGTYTLPTGNPVVTGTTVTSTWANTTANDIGTELTNSLDRNGRGGMLAAFKLADGTLSAPGFGFLNESTTGLARLYAGALSVDVLANEVARFTATGLNNASIGATTPAAGAFTGLSATGATTLNTLSVTGATTLAALSLTGTLSGVQFASTANNGGVNSGFYVNSANPFFGVKQSGAGADLGVWDIGAIGGSFLIRAVKDDNSAAANILAITRAGVGASAFTVNCPFFGTSISVASISGANTAGAGGTFAGNGGSTDSSGTCSLLVNGPSTSPSTNGAVIGFNRQGFFALKVGLDSANNFFIGGWSDGGGITRALWDSSGNLTNRGNITAQQLNTTNIAWQSAGGASYSNNMLWQNTTVGATNASKYWRIGPTGTLEMVNSAYTQVVFSLTDGGAGYFAGNVSAPSFTVSSQAKLKNIVRVRDEAAAFKAVMSMVPKQYTLKAEKTPRLRTGLIVEETTDDVVVEGKFIDTYALLSEVVASQKYMARQMGLL